MKPEEIPKPGTKVTLELPCMFATPEKPTYTRRVTIMSEPYQHGYITPGGGWGLYKIDEDDEPCWKVKVRRYREQKIVSYNVNYLISCKVGW